MLRLTADDGSLSAFDDVQITVNPAGGGGGPTLVAPPLNLTVATTLFDASKFLYTGAGAVQTGVAPGTIVPVRAAVVRGKVTTRDGNPLPGVQMTILNHPQFGQTLSRADGMFDMAVNGGGYLTVDYQKTGFLPAQRQINVPWQDYVVAADVVLIPLDTNVTTIAANAGVMQVHQANVSTDSDGSRKATLLFPAGTTATMTLANGTTQPLTTLNVRATEYTVGANGPNAMPGLLPPTSAYTYAVELSADEAIAAGAKSVVFNQPVINYVENFLNFPVGGIAPSGYYDRYKGQWIASANGRVIRIAGVTGGLADVDTVGTSGLPPLVLSNAERQQLAALYAVGQTLWRVPISHFTPWDVNWPFAPPPDATPPNQRPPNTPINYNDPCESKSSIIGCQNQTLGEALAVNGSRLNLHYQSDRVPGRRADYTLTIPLSGSSVPASLKRIELVVQVAGRTFQQSFTAAPNQQTQFTWDGLDAYGRRLQGRQTVTGSIGYVYDVVYTAPIQVAAAFARLGGAPIAGIRGRTDFTVFQPLHVWLVPLDGRAFGVGGWTLSAHHFYDPVARVLHLGNGGRRSADSLGQVITTVAGQDGGYGGDGGPATQARLLTPTGVAVGPDGSLYIADLHNNAVRRIDFDGIITTVAGNGVFGFSGDGGPATAARLGLPRGVALGLDGSLYIADSANHRVRHVGLDGIITTVAGNGVFGFSGDGGPATAARLFRPTGVTVGPDGSLYIADTDNFRIRQVGLDGIITTVAGNGVFGFGGDGGRATQASLLNPGGVALGPDGSLYIADTDNTRIRRVGLDGIITTVAGNGVFGFSGDPGLATESSLQQPQGITVAPDGGLYIADTSNHRIRRVGLEGIITTVAGNGLSDFSGDGGRATQASIFNPYGVVVAPDGGLYIADSFNHRIRRVAPSLPGFSGSDIAIASEDGGQLYQFDATGRHLRTLHSLTGAILSEFTYDSAGRLASVIEKTGGTDNVTAIERDGTGNPMAIVAPFGQRTTLGVDANGFLASISNPAGEQTQLAYTTEGLLTAFTDQVGNVSRYGYDGLGRLIRAEDPVGGIKTLARSETLTSTTIMLTMPSGRTSTYVVETLPTGVLRRVNDDGAGGQTEVLSGTDGSQRITYPDGTNVDLLRGPDPRFGMQVPIRQSYTLTAPNGLTKTITTQRSVALADPNNPLSIQTLTDTFTVNGQTSSATYDAATRTLIQTSPAGRTTSVVHDPQGRVVSATPATGLAPLTRSYDSRGRLSQLAQGPQGWTYTYDALGRVASRTDAAGRLTQFSYDAADRPIRVTSPSGGEIQFTYDARGNRTQVTLPSGVAHNFAYDAVNQMVQYAPPGNAPLTRSYNLDRALSRITLPGGRIVDHLYDANGRPAGQSYPEATTAYEHAPGLPSDRVSRIAWAPTDGGPTQESQFGYTGELPTSVNWTGIAQGQVSYSFDANFLVDQLTFTSGTDSMTVGLPRDIDGLATAIGPFAIDRNGPGGAPSQITDGTMATAITYDTLARLVRRTQTVAGQVVYDLQLTYDVVGRIAQRVETVAGTGQTFVYTYDADSQLTTVSRNGVVVEQYAYDVNGNRTSRAVDGGAAQAATYDLQDRLVQRAGISYQTNADGFVTQRGSDSFTYSARGELLQASVGGQVVSYAYNGLGLRVARTVAGATTQYFYANLGNATLVTHTRDAAGVLTTLFYDDGGYLFALERGGARFAVATDQVGSPRVVTDAAGAVVKVVEYDNFGVVRSDSNPTFELPIGYAGGIADSTTGVVRFGFRDYEPQAGRWMARDPALFGGGQGNLYGYVHNNPVHLRDPLGLFCIGGSYYAGIGGGASVCITEEGVSGCIEAGFGLGAEVKADSEGLADTGTEIGVELSAGCGSGSAGLSAGIDSNGCLKTKGEACVGSFCCDTNGNCALKEESEKTGVKVGSCKFNGKIAGKACASSAS